MIEKNFPSIKSTEMDRSIFDGGEGVGPEHHRDHVRAEWAGHGLHHPILSALQIAIRMKSFAGASAVMTAKEGGTLPPFLCGNQPANFSDR